MILADAYPVNAVLDDGYPQTDGIFELHAVVTDPAALGEQTGTYDLEAEDVLLQELLVTSETLRRRVLARFELIPPEDRMAEALSRLFSTPVKTLWDTDSEYALIPKAIYRELMTLAQHHCRILEPVVTDA